MFRPCSSREIRLKSCKSVARNTHLITVWVMSVCAVKNPYKNTEQDIGKSQALLEDLVNTAFQKVLFFFLF